MRLCARILSPFSRRGPVIDPHAEVELHAPVSARSLVPPKPGARRPSGDEEAAEAGAPKSQC